MRIGIVLLLPVVLLAPAAARAGSGTFSVFMTGDQEVPGPGDSDGQASGSISLDDSTGAVSWSFIFSNIDALPDDLGKTVALCQTTITREKFEQLVDYVRQTKYPELRAVDTRCKPVKDQQSAVESLAQWVDLMIIIGGFNSSNTTPGSTVAVRASGSILMVRSRYREQSSGTPRLTAPPARPVPAPRAVSGRRCSPQILTAPATSSTDFGSTTTSGTIW